MEFPPMRGSGLFLERQFDIEEERREAEENKIDHDPLIPYRMESGEVRSIPTGEAQWRVNEAEKISQLPSVAAIPAEDGSISMLSRDDHATYLYEKMKNLEEEAGVITQPLLDPIDAAITVFFPVYGLRTLVGATAKGAVKVGAGGAIKKFAAASPEMMPKLSKILTAGVPAGVSELALGAALDPLSDDHPITSVLLMLVGGLLTGMTVERMIDTYGQKALNTKFPRLFKNHLKRVKDEMDTSLGDQLLEIMDDLAIKADAGDPEALDQLVKLYQKEEYALSARRAADDAAKGDNIVQKKRVGDAEFKQIETLTAKLDAVIQSKGIHKLAPEDLENLRHIAVMEAQHEYDAIFVAMKQAAVERVAKNEYPDLPMTRIRAEIIAQGGIEPIATKPRSLRSYRSGAVSADMSNNIKSKFPEMFKEGGKANLFRIAKNEGITIEKLMRQLEASPTVKQYQAKVARGLNPEWDEMYQMEVAFRAANKELNFIKKAFKDAGIGMPSPKGKGLRVVPAQTIRKVLLENTSLRRGLAKSFTTAEKRVATALKQGTLEGGLEQRIQDLQKMVDYKQSLADRSIYQKNKGDLRRIMTRKSLGTDYKAFLGSILNTNSLFKLPKRLTPLSSSDAAMFVQRKVDEGNLQMEVLQPEIAEVWDMMARYTNLKDMTIEDHAKLVDVVKKIAKAGSDELTILSKGRRRAINHIVEEIKDASAVMSNGKKIYRGDYKEVPITQREDLQRKVKTGEAVLDKIKKTTGYLLGGLNRIEFIARALDAFQDGGIAWRTLFKPFVLAQEGATLLQNKVYKRFNNLLSKHTSIRSREYLNTKHTVGGFTANKEEAIMMMLNTGNPENKRALLHGLGSRIIKDGDEAWEPLAEETLDRFLRESLSKEDLEVVNDMWDMLESLYPVLNRTYRKMTGGDLTKVDGRYMPIVRTQKYDHSTAQLTDLFTAHSSSSYWAQVDKGMLHGRVGGVRNLKLNFNVLTRHIDSAIHLTTHWEAVNNVQRVIKNPAFKATVRQRLGTNTYNQFEPWLKKLARPRQKEFTGADRVFRSMRMNVTAAVLGLKVTTALVQPMSAIAAVPSIAQGKLTVGSFELIRGLGSLLVPGSRSKMKNLSSEMRFRNNTFNRELNDIRDDMMLKKGAFKRFGAKGRDLMFTFIRVMDRIGADSTWLASYNYMVRTSKGNINKAVEYADSVVRRTQPTSSMKDLPQVMTSGEGMKLFTMFYSYYSVLQNSATELINRRRIGQVSWGKMAASAVYMFIVPATITALIRERKTDIEDPETWETYAKSILGHTAGMLPIVRDIVNSELFGFDFQPSPVTGVVSATSRAGQAVYDNIVNEEELELSDWRNTVTAMGYLGVAPIPSGQIGSFLKAYEDYDIDEWEFWVNGVIKTPTE